jgi:hypothetical protein
MTNGYILKERGWEPGDGTEYSVQVFPGLGSIYDIYPACPKCMRTGYHECEAQGPKYRVFVPRY